MAMWRIGRLARFLSKRVRTSQGKIDRTALMSKSAENPQKLIQNCFLNFSRNKSILLDGNLSVGLR